MVWAALIPALAAAAQTANAGSQGGSGQQVMQPYSNSGAISVGGNGMPAGPIPKPPASPFALFNPFPSQGGTGEPMDIGPPLMLGMLALGTIAIVKSKKGR